jgi:hypothetical protein
MLARIRRLLSAVVTLVVRLAAGVKGAFLRYRRLIHLGMAATVVALIAYDMQTERPPRAAPEPQPAAQAAPPPQPAAKAADASPATEPPKQAVETAAAGLPAEPAATAPAAAPRLPSFQDARPLAAATQQESRSSAAPGLSFRDERPVAAPSFRDERVIVTPAPAQTPAQAPAQATTLQEPAAAPPSGAAQLPTLVTVPPATLKVDAATCSSADVQTEPLEGGRMRIGITATCRPGEAVQISYGGAEIIRRLDTRGSLEYVLDCFAGAAAPAELRFADGTRQSVPIAARDLDAVSKIAVIWRAPVNLDLHVFEYAARYDDPGHLWSKAPSSMEAARTQVAAEKRGHGYLSTSDSEASLGDKVEVYTFLHSDEQTSGAISMALDYETRGELPAGATCGQGALAEIDFQVSMRPRGGQPTRQSGVLTRVDCGQRIAREARLNQAALPGLRIRR